MPKFKVGDRCIFQSRLHDRDARNGEECRIIPNLAKGCEPDNVAPWYLAVFSNGSEERAVREDELSPLPAR